MSKGCICTRVYCIVCMYSLVLLASPIATLVGLATYTALTLGLVATWFGMTRGDPG